MDGEESEHSLLGCVRRIIEERMNIFDEVGLTPELRDPRSSGNGPSANTEVAIYFWDTSLLAKGKRCLGDVLEFNLVENGRPTMDLSDLSSWLRAACDDVIDRRRHNLKAN